MDESAARELLLSGMGDPSLAAVLRPVAMDPKRLQQFVDLWNSNQVIDLGDIITTMVLTERVQDVSVAANGRRTLLRFQDAQVNHVLRIQASAYAIDEDAAFFIPPSTYRLLVQLSSRSNLTSAPTPVSHLAGTGLDSWMLPIPIRMAPQSPVSVTVEWDDAMGDELVVADLTVSLTCVRLVF